MLGIKYQTTTMVEFYKIRIRALEQIIEKSLKDRTERMNLNPDYDHTAHTEMIKKWLNSKSQYELALKEYQNYIDEEIYHQDYAYIIGCLQDKNYTADNKCDFINVFCRKYVYFDSSRFDEYWDYDESVKEV